MRNFLLFFVSFINYFSLLQAEDYPVRFEGKFKEWEQKQSELISLFLPQNPVILQAGGHYGNETVRLAEQWPSGSIISFEPNPHAFEILFSKIENYSNVHPYPLALNTTAGLAPFYVCHGTYGKDSAFEHASSLLKPSPCMEIHYQGPRIDVNCVVLDDWCQENSIDQVDFLALDLQGLELEVLKNSPNILKQLSCISIHTYSFPFRIGTALFSDLRKFLEDAGFQLIAHWHRENLDGKAIFVKNDFFFNREIDEYLKKHQITKNEYKRFHEPHFNVFYDLDSESKDSFKDTIKDTLKQGRAYEGNIGDMIAELTKPSSLAIDIGSHIGVHTITMSRKVGPEGAVIAFEPNKKLYNELLHTLSLNKCTNVISISRALSDCPKTVLLNDITIQKEESEHATGDIVDTITLDSLNLNNVSLIKMDVENYEYFVLSGAQETILRNKPVMIFECWIGANYENSPLEEKENFDRVISLIESFGYEIYVIYSNDFIAFPIDGTPELENYKKKFKKLDLRAFDLGL